MMVTLSRLYDDDAAAQKTVRDLLAAGLPQDDIGVIASTRRVKMRNADLENTGDRIDRDGDGSDDRGQAAERGAGVGAMLGGAAGLLAGLGLLALPGIGPVVAAGWLASAITGALTGGAAGGVIGALIEAGFSENDANGFLDGVKRGGTVVTLRVSGRDRALYEEILDHAGTGLAQPAGMPVQVAAPDTESNPV